MSYTPHPDEMLKEMNRLLKAGGLMWLEFYNALGWAIENSSLTFKLQSATEEEDLIRMSDWDYPARIFSTTRVSELCNSAGFEVQRFFGNHVLMSSIPMDRIYSHQFESADLELLKEAELRLSKRPDCVGASKICQALVKKI